MRHAASSPELTPRPSRSHIESRNLKVPVSAARAAGGSTFAASAAPAPEASAGAGAGAAGGAGRRREARAAGAARLFGYLEASDGSGDEYEAPALAAEFAPAVPPAQHYARDKENAAPLHHMHEHCLRY